MADDILFSNQYDGNVQLAGFVNSSVWKEKKTVNGTSAGQEG